MQSESWKQYAVHKYARQISNVKNALHGYTGCFGTIREWRTASHFSFKFTKFACHRRSSWGGSLANVQLWPEATKVKMFKWSTEKVNWGDENRWRYDNWMAVEQNQKELYATWIRKWYLTAIRGRRNAEEGGGILPSLPNSLENRILRNDLQRGEVDISGLPISSLCDWRQTELKGSMEETFVQELISF